MLNPSEGNVRVAGSQGSAEHLWSQVIQIAGYVVRRVRTPRGRTRLARIIERYAPEGDVRYRDQWGFERGARLHDDIEAQNFVGVYELPREVNSLIKPGDWVIDAGASIGALTAQFCHLVGPSGLVWAIEPVPYNIARLQQLRDLNGLGQLRVFAGALGASAGTAALQLPREGETGFASFTKSWGMGEMIEVPVWTLDELVEGVGRRLAFLKIDVEGYEPQVLAGAEKTLRTMRPLILCEFNDILLRDAGASSEQLLAVFAEYGYIPLSPPPPLSNQVVDILLSAGESPGEALV